MHVHALFDAAIRQQLQGPPGAGAARHSVSSWSRSTSCKAKAARPNSSPRIRAARCRCWRSRPTVISPNRTRSCGTSPAARTLAPEDRIERAEALQWMFFEQHSLEPNIGAAYFWLALIKGGRDLQSTRSRTGWKNGYRALGVMEMHLGKHRYLRRRPLHHRRHRALRLHPPGGSVRFRAASAFRRSAPGSPGSRPNPAMYRWTGSRSWRRRNRGAPFHLSLTPPSRKRHGSSTAAP